MTAAFLQAELSTLISDSKRKHVDIRVAAEKSLLEIKAIAVTSETQLSGDLARKPYFIDPFVLACKSQNVRLASTGATGLQRCVAATAVPRSRLPDVLLAYEEAAPLALDVQLKILQTLPSLLQLYAADLHGRNALGRALSIASDLSASKHPIVNKTAAATFQQLITAVFARISGDVKTPTRNPDESTATSRNFADATAIFIDLCALLTAKQTDFVRLGNLAPSAVLEVLEAILSNHGHSLFLSHDAITACSHALIPGICTLVESSSNYGVVVRAVRIAFVLGTLHLKQVSAQLVAFLAIMLKFADRPPTQKWKRVLSLEFFRGICSNFETIRAMFMLYDLQEGTMSLVSGLMASLVRIASEDPSLIGLGRQSTVPPSKATDNASDTVGVIEMPLGTTNQSKAFVAGISTEWSIVSTPCLDSFDRATPIEVPETYIFTLVLGCISAFSDGLSKFIMPLSIPNERSSRRDDQDVEDIDTVDPQPKAGTKESPSYHKYQQLVNPLTLTDPSKRENIENCAKMIEDCWPAVLAICSTFLNASLDSYFYHMLIRTAQKLTQVSGVLDLETPRDALLTTLAKVSVPVNVAGLMSTLYAGKSALLDKNDTPLNMDKDVIKSPTASTAYQSLNTSTQHLNIRNLLCLRALLNLGIALGPSLSQAAWSIVLQSLQQVEALMSAGPGAGAGLLQLSATSPEVQEGDSTNNLASEIAAVDTARRRMIESTRTYSQAAFEIFCQALLQIVADIVPNVPLNQRATTSTNGTPGPESTSYNLTRKVSGQWVKIPTLEVEVDFVLKTLGRIASVNLYRFQDEQSSAASWNLLVAPLLLLQRNVQLLPSIRLQCAKIIDAIVFEVCASHDENDSRLCAEGLNIATEHGIPALLQQLDTVQYQLSGDFVDNELVGKIVQMLLETLQSLVGSCGESLDVGWYGIFEVLDTVVTILEGSLPINTINKLYGQAFKVTQLIISDFLPVLDDISVQSLLKLFEKFASQSVDLNIALTTSALYWSVASMIIERTTLFKLDAPMENTERNVAAPPNLWSQTMVGLGELSKDVRPEIRNAALRILAKVFDASLDGLEPAAMNSSLTRLWLALLTSYSQIDTPMLSEPWLDSISAVLVDVQRVINQCGAQMMGDRHFATLWHNIIQAFEGVLKMQELKTTSSTFQALTGIISFLRRSENATVFNSNNEATNAVWWLWSTYNPADIDIDASNEEVISTYASLLLELADWRFDLLSKSQRSAPTVETAVERIVFAARHFQYTLDIKKLSRPQALIIRIIDLLQRLLIQKSTEFQTFILHLVEKIILKNYEAAQEYRQPISNMRVPTNIALATACIRALRANVQSKTDGEDIHEQVIIADIMAFSVALTKTKYSTLPSNDQDPLWQQGCILGIECVAIVRSRCHNVGNMQSHHFNECTARINDLIEAIMSVPHLENLDVEKRPSVSQLENDETFDMTQLADLHIASIATFNHLETPQPQLRTYVMHLFRNSFVAEPWYSDLAPNIEQDPLRELTKIRYGSVRYPLLPIRQKLYATAMTCLFDLVSRDHKVDPTPAISLIAAPYTIVRLAHTLKTFIADQPLRHLEEPHAALQAELHVMFKSFVELRVIDNAFVQVAIELGSDMKHDQYLENINPARDFNAVIKPDGKSHLRLMFPLLLKFEEVWYKMPRLDLRHYSWQAGEDGRAIEKYMKSWRTQVSEGWGPTFA